MATFSDIVLVTQVAVSGNKRAFDELVRRYQSPVRRFFLHQTLGNSQLSDDLAQDTFIKAYTNIASFRGLASFQTWLMRIAYNVFYDYTRREKNKVSSDGIAANKEGGRSDDSPPDRIMESKGGARHESSDNSTLKMDIHTALALLKPEERTCITLQLIEGYDIAAISKITSMKEGTVKSHLSRGKEKLANFLRENGYERR